MSSIKAKVLKIDSCDSLHIVKFGCNDETLTMLSLELNPNVKLNKDVILAIKPTHIAISKTKKDDISYANQLSTTIKDIENGKLISSIKLDFFGTSLESIITCESSKRLNLKVGDKVVAFIKSSDISIGQVCDD